MNQIFVSTPPPPPRNRLLKSGHYRYKAGLKRLNHTLSRFTAISVNHNFYLLVLLLISSLFLTTTTLQAEATTDLSATETLNAMCSLGLEKLELSERTWGTIEEAESGEIIGAGIIKVWQWRPDGTQIEPSFTKSACESGGVLLDMGEDTAQSLLDNIAKINGEERVDAVSPLDQLIDMKIREIKDLAFEEAVEEVIEEYFQTEEGVSLSPQGVDLALKELFLKIAAGESDIDKIKELMLLIETEGGEQGPPGATGPMGPPGATGPMGPEGPAGCALASGDSYSGGNALFPLVMIGLIFSALYLSRKVT